MYGLIEPKPVSDSNGNLQDTAKSKYGLKCILPVFDFVWQCQILPDKVQLTDVMFYNTPHTVPYLGTLCPNTPQLRVLKVGEPNTPRAWHLFNKWSSNRNISLACQTHCSDLKEATHGLTQMQMSKAPLWNMSAHQSEPCQSLSSKCLRLGLKKVGVMTPGGCFHILEEVKMNETADDDRPCQVALECAETDGKALGIFVTVWYVALYSPLFILFIM